MPNAVIYSTNEEYRGQSCTSLFSLQHLLYLNITDKCFSGYPWYLFNNIDHWQFAPQQMTLSFPVDTESRNYIRQVKDAIFSVVYPTGLQKNPVLAAISKRVLTDILDLNPVVQHSNKFLQFVSGNEVKHGTKPLAHR